MCRHSLAAAALHPEATRGLVARALGQDSTGARAFWGGRASGWNALGWGGPEVGKPWSWKNRVSDGGLTNAASSSHCRLEATGPHGAQKLCRPKMFQHRVITTSLGVQGSGVFLHPILKKEGERLNLRAIDRVWKNAREL